MGTDGLRVWGFWSRPTGFLDTANKHLLYSLRPSCMVKRDDTPSDWNPKDFFYLLSFLIGAIGHPVVLVSI